MTAIVAPETLARNALIALLKTEFAVEKYAVKSDRLHGSLGSQSTVLGVYPVRTAPWSKDYNVANMELAVQFFGKYELKTDPYQTVNPAKIEANAERFRQALRKNITLKSGEVWYFTLVRLLYTPDPTGNITRFVATLLAYGNNSAVLETS